MRTKNTLKEYRFFNLGRFRPEGKNKVYPTRYSDPCVEKADPYGGDRLPKQRSCAQKVA